MNVVHIEASNILQIWHTEHGCIYQLLSPDFALFDWIHGRTDWTVKVIGERE